MDIVRLLAQDKEKHWATEQWENQKSYATLSEETDNNQTY